ncbi:hypothetical protein [Homoserinibacter sp. YIM 151385]|uniref:hypothetical protein n=1 Tax=Homoserinibacter sp. YIM 151385 TaxID=2985506 RepID=UPI0022F0449B|nr:hypothetical protein [Homoserinibacter sp. YIM 151385]WBU38863.1 hypothetical protein OF852_04585 [Homoserinibacter sp. YIM 151385]
MTALWIVQLALVIASIALALALPRARRPLAALLGAVPIVLGVLLLVFDAQPLAPAPAWGAVLSLAFALLGIVAGSPAASLVLDWAERGEPAPRGKHGGIMILAKRESGEARVEVLRGGAAVGYLERTAIVAAVVLGRLEIAAAVIAIKGLGRFSDLESAEARERFIIGTLASMLWAGACAGLAIAPSGLLG